MKGTHWRPYQEFRDREFLIREYCEKGRTAAEIGQDFGVGATAIQFWMRKHEIKGRPMDEVRRLKHWGNRGQTNPMFGRRGELHPNWRGGTTPERQRVYSSIEWAEAVKAVWARDEGICTDCGCKGERGHRMHIHHNLPFNQHPQARTDPNYLRLVCSGCHAKYHRRKCGIKGR